MKVMIAGLTASRQYFESARTFLRGIRAREGDGMFVQHGTRGDVGREIVCREFLKSDKDALLLLDLDQKFPEDTLEKLRAHDKDMVSGHYMKRSTKVLQSIWQYTLDGGWPYLPYLYDDIPKEGLHRIAQTGMGCVLIKRKVIEAVARMMPPGANPFEIGKIPEISPIAANFGSDYRFFYYAQKLGYELWGDASIDTPHASTMWLTRDILDRITPTPEKDAEYLFHNVFSNTIRSLGMVTLNAIEARRIALQKAIDDMPDEVRKTVEKIPEKYREYLIVAGQINEAEIWRKELAEKSPPPGVVQAWKRPEKKIFGTSPVEYQKQVDLPTFKSKAEMDSAVANREVAIQGESPEEATQARIVAQKNQAIAAVRRMNGRGPIQDINTSTEPGSIEEIT